MHSHLVFVFKWMFWHEMSDGQLRKCWQLSSASHLMLRALLFRLQWQKTTYLYTLLLPLEVPPSTPWPTPSARRWMERWTMETATAVTAARDARPCQLCEWHTRFLSPPRSVQEKRRMERSFSSTERVNFEIDLDRNMFQFPPKMHKNFLMHDIRSNRMSEKTINTVRRNDIGVVYGVKARAVTGLPAEKETPPFSKLPSPDRSGRKNRSPSVILTASLWTLLYTSCCLTQPHHNQNSQFVQIFTKCQNTEWQSCWLQHGETWAATRSETPQSR